MQLTKYRTKGNNVAEQLHNASIISKQLLILIVENETHENNLKNLLLYGEPIAYMKNILFNSNLCLYNGEIHIKLNRFESLHTYPFLNTSEFKLCLGLTNRPKLKKCIVIPDYIIDLL